MHHVDPVKGPQLALGVMAGGEDLGYIALRCPPAVHPSQGRHNRISLMKIQSCPPLLQPANGFSMAPEHYPVPLPGSQDLLPSCIPHHHSTCPSSPNSCLLYTFPESLHLWFPTQTHCPGPFPGRFLMNIFKHLFSIRIFLQPKGFLRIAM